MMAKDSLYSNSPGIWRNLWLKFGFHHLVLLFHSSNKRIQLAYNVLLH